MADGCAVVGAWQTGYGDAAPTLGDLSAIELATGARTVLASGVYANGVACFDRDAVAFVDHTPARRATRR